MPLLFMLLSLMGESGIRPARISVLLTPFRLLSCILVLSKESRNTAVSLSQKLHTFMSLPRYFRDFPGVNHGDHS